MAKKPQIVHELVIDERRWLHAEKDDPEGNYEGMLRNEEGKMCCLGFFAQSCGVKAKDMLNLGMPADLNRIPKKLREMAFDAEDFGDGDVDYSTKDVIQDLADANDEEGLTLARRKQRITRLFRQIGVGVTFVNPVVKK
jgi:hypothetical protein